MTSGAVKPDPAQASAEFLAAVPHEFAREHGVLSQGVVDEVETILRSPTADANAVHNLGVCLGRRIAVVEADGELLARAIDEAYEQRAGHDEAADATAEVRAVAAVDDAEIDRLLGAAERDLLATSGKAPVVRLVDSLLFRAVQLGASDLHIQPLVDVVVIRHRVDGVLDEGRTVPVQLLRPLVSRIKVQGRMDVAERLVPQDGRTTVTIGTRAVDVRISTMPTPHGERVVLRLLDARAQLQVFADLGMPQAVADRYLAAARRSSGIVLVTGPTGSGKTTTLYGTLRELDSRERNIMTIEDPIEYELDTLGLPISQSQVNTRKGVTFANGLRHILRQDPDVILVGEIRDAETARVAIQSSLTGHLVFSTLHTNDAVSAVTRLIDLGVEPYLVAASLSVVLAQRLVRQVCSECTGAGCDLCNSTGFKGRTGVFELLAVDDGLRALIARGSSLEELRSHALAAGMQTLAQAGQALMESGRTTAVEVERVVHG
ncbi:MAG: GspE/PulE family protein [Planctomycetota bacterium]|jgi:general secretion pathway protein E|nr:GspE/PulE family protein [Planctomycetota bacterium]